MDLKVEISRYLTKLYVDHKDRKSRDYWMCKCVCGNLVILREDNFTGKGKTISCGCRKGDI